jgi:hypothetical protein
MDQVQSIVIITYHDITETRWEIMIPTRMHLNRKGITVVLNGLPMGSASG